MEIYVYLIVLMGITLSHASSSAAWNKTCEFMKGRVWTCNYIPVNIPDGVKQIHIQQFIPFGVTFEVNRTYFTSENWQSVKYLEITDNNNYNGPVDIDITFKDGTFRDLKALQELHIHIPRIVFLEPDSLLGLQNLRILDFNQCIRLEIKYIKEALNGSEKVPNLEQLLLSQVSYFEKNLKVDREFSKCLAQKPIFLIDLSKTRIPLFEYQFINDFGTLKILNGSRAVVSGTSHRNVSIRGLQHLDVLDISYAIVDELTFPSNMRNLSISNVNIPIKDKGQHLSMIFSIEIWNISGVNRNLNNIFLHNIKAWWMDSVKSRTREIIAKQNGIRRLDVDMTCDNMDFNTFELLNLANNGLEYMHPSIFGCIYNLANLDLSDNNLHVMYIENANMFGKLLKGSKYLKTVSLAFNGLTDIPDEFFENNTLLEIINLAGNRLDQVHFSLRHLGNLRILNLANNEIKILDDSSMQSLDALSAVLKLGKVSYNTVSEPTPNVTLEVNIKTNSLMCVIKDNPLLCDTCDKKEFISWLSEADFIDTLSDNVRCRSDTGEQLQVNKKAVTIVQYVCDRNTKNIVLIIVAAVVSVGGTSAVFILYMRRRRVRKKRRINEVINELRNVEDRFAVFLSYSSDDFNFVNENVIAPLNENLQAIIGTDRNLVCQGDTQFHLGRYVHNESLRCIELSEVFLCVISNSYCNSNYCDSEFNQAMQLKTPVILMMKDEVDVDLLTPAMQLLFRNNVRVLWEYENEQYKLKTSWQNVCESIIDLASN